MMACGTDDSTYTGGNIRYWDYHSDCTTGTTASTYTVWATASTTDSSYSPPRRVIVTVPKSWGRKERAHWTRLINDETKTGWRIEMWINGDIDICDPSIEVRSLKNFVPLLKQRASQEDRQKIDDFFLDAAIED